MEWTASRVTVNCSLTPDLSSSVIITLTRQSKDQRCSRRSLLERSSTAITMNTFGGSVDNIVGNEAYDILSFLKSFAFFDTSNRSLRVRLDPLGHSKYQWQRD